MGMFVGDVFLFLSLSLSLSLSGAGETQAPFGVWVSLAGMVVVGLGVSVFRLVGWFFGAACPVALRARCCLGRV